MVLVYDLISKSHGNLAICDSENMTMQMNRRSMVKILGAGCAMASAYSLSRGDDKSDEVRRDMIRIGMIGLDTSHVSVFTKLLNENKNQKSNFAGCKIVAAYPAGNPEFPLSRDRIEGFTNEVRGLGVKIVDSIDALLRQVDAVMVMSVDGRQHLEQARRVLAANKPLFIDKPLAASLADALIIADLGQEHQTPWFTASSSRFTEGYPELKNNQAIGDIIGCDVYSQARAAIGHPDLFWYGIHGVDLLYSLMSTGCQSVTAIQTNFTEQVTGSWEGGRVGTYRAIREHTGKTGLGATVFGTAGIAHVNNYYNYVPLLTAIVEFFRTKTAPIPIVEMMEVMTFLEAAEESKRRAGISVALAEVREMAKTKRRDVSNKSSR